MKSGALISPCGRFRWWLARPIAGGLGIGFVLWVMLNPSTADARVDDPTIRRCIGFTQNWGFDRLAVANAYAYRTSSPAALKAAGYPIGEECDSHLIRLAREASLIVAAWGGHIQPTRAAAVLVMLRRHAPVYTLGWTKAGQPLHPLYLPGDSPLIEWRAAA